MSHGPPSILGVLLRAIYDHRICIIQLLVRGGSTQSLGVAILGFGSFWNSWPVSKPTPNKSDLQGQGLFFFFFRWGLGVQGLG